MKKLCSILPLKALNEDTEDNCAGGLQDSRQIITAVLYRMSLKDLKPLLSVLILAVRAVQEIGVSKQRFM